MILCVAGDIHGAIDEFYDKVLEFEDALNVTFAWVLQVGDFGIWPDPNRIDRKTRMRGGAGDFPRWLTEQRPVPRPTLFVKGNHEDFTFLEEHRGEPLLPGLIHLPNGETFDLVSGDEMVRVGGIGGCFAPTDFERAPGTLQGYARRHYLHEEIRHLCEQPGIDIVLFHDAPAGLVLSKPRGGREQRYLSVGAGLRDALSGTHPRVCFFGHHHIRVTAEVRDVPCLGLARIDRPGCLVAVEIPPEGRGWRLLGER